jgi:hypothetical protein
MNGHLIRDHDDDRYDHPSDESCVGWCPRFIHSFKTQLRGMRGQCGTCILFVNLHLRNQIVDRCEFFFVAKVLDEVDMNVLAGRGLVSSNVGRVPTLATPSIGPSGRPWTRTA